MQLSRPARSWTCAIAAFCHWAVCSAVVVGQEAISSTLQETDSRTLYLRAGEVDLRAKPSLLSNDDGLDPGRHYVLQLDGPITRPRREALSRLGVKLGDYLPMHAYVADLGGASAAEVAGLGFVKWAGSFESSWKLCPEIGLAALASPERQALSEQGSVRLICSLFDDADVNQCLELAKTRGATVRRVVTAGSRRRLVVDIDLDDVQALSNVDDILFIEEDLEPTPRTSSTNWIIQSNDGIGMSTPLWDAGLHGEGQVAGIIDWYMRPDHCAFSEPGKIVAYYGQGGSQSTGYHGTHVAGVLLGDPPGGSDINLTGIAYESQVVFHNINAVPFDVEQLLITSHTDGARVHNNSWGFSGVTNYHSSSRDIDAFSRDHEEDLVLVAVENGNGMIQVPENAKNCLAVAATFDAPNQEFRCDGAHGPTVDGRRKPEVLAPGCDSFAADIAQQCGTNSRNGTSFASPAVAALGILARQYFMDGYYPTGVPELADAFVPSGALLRAVLINSAVDMSGIAGYPGTSEGWGRVLADGGLFFAGDTRKLVLEDVRHALGLGPGDDPRTHEIEVLGSSEPLKVTLVWTDVPGVEGVSFTPANNLDLEVMLPDQTTYLGNVFVGGQSATGGSADPVNNVEQVHLSNPPTGVYTIAVKATAIPVDTQGYALVVTGDVAAVTFSCESATAGDANNDGLVNGRDTQDFITAVMEFGGVFDTIAKCASDIGSPCDACAPDGAVDINDVPGFVSLLLGGPCQTNLKGDMDFDVSPNGLDIQEFTGQVLSFDGTIDTALECAADIGSPGFPCTPDGLLDENDVPGFASILLGTGCQP